MESINNTEHRQQEKQLKLRDVFDFVVSNWVWFVLSTVLFLAVGYVTYRLSPRSYSAYATVLIDEENSRGVGSELTDMRVTRMMRQGRNVDNEIQILRSRSLMLKAVKALDANIHYYTSARLRYVEFYAGLSPLILTVDTLSQPFTVDVVKFNTDSYSAKLKYGEHVRSITAGYGERVQVAEGTGFTINRGAKFDTYIINGNGDHDLRIRVNSYLGTMSQYMGATSISMLDKVTSIVVIRTTDPVPQKCADLISALVRLYNEDAVKSKQAAAMLTRDFINERLSVIDDELSTVDSQMEELKRQNRSVNVASEASLYLANANRYQEQLDGVVMQAELVRMVRDFLASSRGQIKALPMNLGIEDVSLNAGIVKYNDLVMQRTRLGGDGVGDNPVVRDLTTQILDMQVALMGSLDNLAHSLDIRRRAVEAQVRLTSSKVNSVPILERQTLDIARNQQIKDALYAFLLNRREEANLKFASAQPLGTMIDEPLANSNPVSPKRNFLLLVFLVIGLAVPSVIILLLEALRTTVDSVQEIEAAVPLPVVGIIPTRNRDNSTEQVVSPTSFDPVSEAFRMLRTNIEFTMPAGGKVIMVSSSIPNEGKSFLSINLALTMAIAGKRVLLVDLDMRKASLSEKISGRREMRGIVNYLAGKETDLMSLVTRHGMSDVDMLYVGAVPPNPAELLSGERFKEAVETMRANYDYIILDTPPVSLVADAVVATPVADLTLFSIRIHKSLRRMLPLVGRLAQQGRLRNVNIVISDTGASHPYSRRSGKYSYYGYGYGYEKSRSWFQKIQGRTKKR